MSVHKRGNKWVFRKRVKMPDGTIKNIQRTFDTKKEAQLQEQLFKFENQHENSLKDLTIDQCFLLYKEVKSDEHNDNKVKRYTMYDYSRLYNRNISTYFGKRHPQSVMRHEIENWKTVLNKKGLSWAYKSKIFGFFKSLYKFMRFKFGITNDPFLGVEGFSNKITKTDRSVIEPIQFWTHEEFLKFDSVAYDVSPIKCYKLFFQLAYYTGCRRNELLAMTWEDVDWERKTITITKSLTNTPIESLAEGNDTELTWEKRIDTPKNIPSFRVIDISGFVYERLKSHYEDCKQVDGFNDKCLIMGMHKPLSKTTLARYMDIFCKAAGVKRIKIHDLRHSHASLLIEHGFSLFEVAKRLGHGSIRETERTYAHLFPDAQKRMSESLTKERLKLIQK